MLMMMTQVLITDFSVLSQLTSLPPQFIVKLRQLSEEAIIRSHISVLPQLEQRLHRGHVVSEHEEGQHCSSTPRHSLLTVDQHLAQGSYI